jgi:hypothetical protein
MLEENQVLVRMNSPNTVSAFCFVASSVVLWVSGGASRREFQMHYTVNFSGRSELDLQKVYS